MNLFKRLISKKLLLSILTVTVIFGAFFAYNVSADVGVNITSATGGSAVSIDKTSNSSCSGSLCGQYTSLTGPRIQETAVGQIGIGTYILNLPNGWEFDTSVNVSVGTTGGATGFSVTNSAVFPTSNTLSFTVSSVSNLSPDGINLDGIKVRPTGTLAPTSGNIWMAFSSGAMIIGADGSTNLGTLTTISGVAIKVNVETASNSPTSAKLGSIGLNAESGTQTVYSIRRDQFDNFVDNYSAIWTLVSKTAGIVDGDLTPVAGLNATFAAHKVGTAIIHVNGGGFDSDDSNFVTVHPVAPGNPTFVTVLSHPGYVNDAEESGGITVRVTGLGGAVANDTLELLLNGSPFSIAKIKTLDGTDIANNYVNFTISTGELGDDGLKSLTSKISTLIPSESQTSVGSLDFTLDATEPDTPIITQIGATGNYINIANVGAVHVTGTAEANSTIGVALTSGATVTVSGAANDSGSYDIILPCAGLAEGIVTASVTATDAVGNVSTTPATATATKDTNAPTATAVIVPNSGYAKVGDTVAVTITAGGTQADLALDGSCTINGKDVSGSFVNNANGTYNLTYIVAEGDTDRALGTLPISCVLSEPALNTVTVSSFSLNTLTVDANTPLAPVITSIATDNMINNVEKATIHIVGTAEANSTVNIGLGDENSPATIVLGSGTANGFGNYDIVIDGHTLAEGTIHAIANVTDAAGNVSVDSTRTALKDTIAPLTPVITQIGATGNYINISNVGAVHVTGTAEANSTIGVALTGIATVVANGTATGGSYDITLNCAGLTDGTVTPSVTATDAAGNMSIAAMLPLAIKDTSAPALPTAVAFTSVGGTVTAGYVNTTNTNFTGDAIVTAGDATGGYAELLIDSYAFGNPIKDSTILIGDTSVNFDAGLTSNIQVRDQIASGVHTFTVKLCDAADNCVTSTSSTTATADYIIPTFTSIVFGTDAYVNAAEAFSGVNLSIATTDLENGQVVSCIIEDAGVAHTAGPVTGIINGNSVTIGTGNLTNLDDGTIMARCDVSDLAGNSAAQGTQSVTKDVVAPTGYAVSIDQAYINLATQHAISFTFAGAEIGTTYNYTFSDGTHSVTGTGTINSATQNISIIDLSGLDEGTINLSVTLTDLALNIGSPAIDSVLKDTIVPAVNVGADQTKDALFSQTATATDVGGSGVDATSFAWTKVSGSGNITFGSSNTLTTTIISDVTGRVHYALQFTASDLAGNSAIDAFDLYWTNNSLNTIAFNPANGVTGVAITTGIATVTFDSAVTSIIDASKIDIVRDSDGASVKTSTSLSGGILQIGYSSLAYSTAYRITLAKDAVEDAGGYMSNAATSNFVTVAAPLSPAPTLTSINATPTQYGATITFISNQAGLAKVLYGVGTAYGSATDYATMMVASINSIFLNGLNCNTLYHYKVYAKNSDGVEGSTSDAAFTTSACSDTTAPAISSISLNKPAYRLTQDPTITAVVVEDNTATVVTINGVPGTESLAGNWTATFPHGKSATGEYSFNVVATDASGNSKTILVTYVVIADDAIPAPVVTVINPVVGSTVSGSIAITATNGTEYQIDGGAWVSAGIQWNTASLANGSHTVRAKGGIPTGYSDIIVVIVDNHDTIASLFVAQNPTAGTTGVSINPANLYVSYNEPLDSNTISSNSVKLCLVSDVACTSPVSIGSPILTEGSTRIVLGGGSVTLAYNTAYWIQITTSVTDLAGNPIVAYGSTEESFTTQTEPTGELAIGTAVMIKADGLADDNYSHGWEWKLRITLPTNENAVALRFADWISGANTLLAGGNMQYYSEQITSGAGSAGTPVAITAANTYPTSVGVNTDADSSLAGIQTDIHIQVKIPSTTVGGAYSSSFAVKSEH